MRTRREYILIQLRAIAATIEAENQSIERQKQATLAAGQGFTDPRDGITYFPPGAWDAYYQRADKRRS
jgi:hypothetical protein